MDTMKSMAVILLVSGIAVTVLNLLFFCSQLISRQKKRTAVERSLGTSIPRCAASMLSGVLALVILGAVLGSLSGWMLTGWAAERTAGEETYSTRYSSWSVNAQSGDAAGDETVLQSHRPEAAIPILTGCAVVWIALIIASAAVYINLKTEPLVLLSSRE